MIGRMLLLTALAGTGAAVSPALAQQRAAAAATQSPELQEAARLDAQVEQLYDAGRDAEAEPLA